MDAQKSGHNHFTHHIAECVAKAKKNQLSQSPHVVQSEGNANSILT